MTKLNNKRIRWLVNQIVNKGKKPKELAKIYGITERRVQQLAKEFKETKKYPELNKNRRPKTFLNDKQKQAIDSNYLKTRYTPRILYHELQRQGIPVPKNKIYKYMKNKGWVKNEPRKQKKRKRCRYERDHSGSLIHGDFHRTSENHPHCILWLDDASRKIVAGIETKSATTAIAIKTFKEAINHFEQYDVKIKQANTDRGTQFYNSKYEKNGNRSKSEFELFLESEGIDFIPSRRNNPQTNGKLERRWLEYDKHRWEFSSLQEWIDWHNNRLTTALDIKAYETPNKVFITKMPNVFSLFWRRVENENKGFKKTK